MIFGIFEIPIHRWYLLIPVSIFELNTWSLNIYFCFISHRSIKDSDTHPLFPFPVFRGIFWLSWWNCGWIFHSTLSVLSHFFRSSPRPFVRMTSLWNGILSWLSPLPPHTFSPTVSVFDSPTDGKWLWSPDRLRRLVVPGPGVSWWLSSQWYPSDWD